MRRDTDNPELDDADFARAKPFRAVFPDQQQRRQGLGRPPLEQRKAHIGFRLTADVVEAIRASGPGYDVRVEKVLREAIDEGWL